MTSPKSLPVISSKDLKISIEMSLLYQVSHILVRQRSISTALNEVLDVIRKTLKLQRGWFTLLRDETLYIETGFGLTDEQRARGQYKFGEGITGDVGATGRPALIPNVLESQKFLDRTGAHQRINPCAFICVPICHDDAVIGTLSIDHPTAPIETLEHVKNMLIIVANIVADAVAILREELHEKELLKTENHRLRYEVGAHYQPESIVGKSSAMRAVFPLIARAIESHATVLVRGETGTGKELVARAIHFGSTRKYAPFCKLSAISLSERTFESELFGYELNAFPGATAQRKGRIETQQGGTIYIDEISALSLETQSKIVRLIQDRTFERLGGYKHLPANIRILAGTAYDLEKKVAEKTLLPELYYCLNTLPIDIPPLHARRSDITLLADEFLEKYNALHHKNVRRISTPAINMLMAYHWPGNVRELENAIERAVLTSSNDVINAYDLPPSLQTALTSETYSSHVLPANTNASLATLVASFEREVIVDSLKNMHGNVAAVARALQTSERILHYKLRKMGIDPKRFRA